MSSRRKSRELALQVLYACETGEDMGTAAVLQQVESIAAEGGCDETTRAYGSSLVFKTIGAMAEIDAQIQSAAANWDLKRMNAVDRAIMRMAIAEIRFFSETPFKVVIDEAIELAKAYGTDDSGRFVNGIVDSVRKQAENQDK